MLKDAQQTLSRLMSEAGPAGVGRVWIWRDACVAVEAAHRGVRFGFDVTPTGGDRYSCALVARRNDGGIAVPGGGKRRKTLAEGLTLAEAAALIAARIPRIAARIDRQMAAPDAAAAPAAPEAPAPADRKAARQAERQAERRAERQAERRAARRAGDRNGGRTAGPKPAPGPAPGSAHERAHAQAPAPAPGPVPGPVPAARAPGAARRVGVMTLPLNANYGGNLQAFALMQALRKLGHAPLFINRRHPKGEDAPPVDTLGPLAGTGIGLPKGLPNAAFTDRWLQPMTRRFFSSADLAANAGRLELDAIITGSDQVWRPRYAKSVLTDLFFGFLPEDSPVRRISYAPSFGAETWEYKDRQTREAARLVKRFAAVSVREDTAVDLCRTHFGVAAQHVLDPTLLLEPADYAPVIAEAQIAPAPGRVTTYIFDVDAAKLRLIADLAAALGTSACTTSGAAFPEALPGAAEDRSVQGWVASLAAAGFVVTDSFHGVAFSILFNRPFIAFGHPGRGMARFRSILKLFGLEDRLVVGDAAITAAAALRPIDWDAVNARLAALRAESFRFLQDGVTGGDPAGLPLPGAPAAAAPAVATAVPAAAPLAQAAAPAPILAPTPAPIPASASATADLSPLGTFCSGCGICVAESRGTLAMGWDADGFLVPRETGRGPVPPAAVRVCPFNPAPDPAVADEDALAALFLPDAPQHDARAGRFIGSYIGYSRRFRPTSSSGGIATHVLDRLLARGDVDILFVVESDGAGGYRYQAVTRTADITAMSKTRYYPVSLDRLMEVIATTEGRVAITGVACFIKAVRLKQHHDPVWRERVAFMVGIICGGLKSRSYTDFLAQSAGIAGAYTAPQYRVKNPKSTAQNYAFAATDAAGAVRSIRMRELGDMWGSGLFKSAACDFCTDVLTELADISVGDAWLPKYRPDGMGNSVVVTRSPLADAIIREGMASGDLAMEAVPVGQIVQSQSGGVNHKQNTIALRAAAAAAAGLPVPQLRARLLTPVSAPEALVQAARARTRAQSLRVWRETGDSAAFSRRMRARLAALKALTAARTDGSLPPLALRAALTDPEGADPTALAALRARPVGRWALRAARRAGQQARRLARALRD